MQKIKNQSFIKSFGNKLRDTRKSKNFSQEQLAFEADIPISQIGRIERGEINTTINTVSALAKALKIPAKELFEF